MRIEGHLIKKLPPEVFKEKYTKFSFVIDNGDDKRANPICIECWNQEMWEKIIVTQMGDILILDVVAKGREWNGKYFVNLALQSIEEIKNLNLGNESLSVDDFPETFESNIGSEMPKVETIDDLPF